MERISRSSSGDPVLANAITHITRPLRTLLQDPLAHRGAGTTETASAAGDAKPERGAPVSATVIRTADEAVLAIEKVCLYFERHEPSSPVPLLLRRAQRLVSKNFLDVVQDVCPDALDQIQKLGGISDSDSG